MDEAELVFASIEQVAALLARRKLSPVELLQVFLRRIERLNPQLNAYLSVTGEQALTRARRVEKEVRQRHRGPLHGIPVSRTTSGPAGSALRPARRS